MDEEKKAEKKTERKGKIISLSGTAYINAGAFFKKRIPDLQKKLDEFAKEMKEKK